MPASDEPNRLPGSRNNNQNEGGVLSARGAQQRALGQQAKAQGGKQDEGGQQEKL